MICPNNQVLKYTTTNRDGYREFKSNPHICKSCPYLSQCTNSNTHQKLLTKHIWNDYLELAEDFRHSSRQIDAITDISTQNEWITQNSWLSNECEKLKDISVINFDILPKLCNCDNLTSCDGMLYDFNAKKFSLLIEFKNCDRKTLDKYLNITSNDSILTKLKDSKNLIVSKLEFQGKFTGQALIENTHIVVVYNGKNNKPIENTKMGYTPKQKVSHNKNGKQNRAIRLDINTKDKDSKFGLEVKKLGYVSCLENDFPVPAKPQSEKLKGVGKVRNFSIFSAQDFKKLVEFESQNDGCIYLQDWDWGEYFEYINNNVKK